MLSSGWDAWELLSSYHDILLKWIQKTIYLRRVVLQITISFDSSDESADNVRACCCGVGIINAALGFYLLIRQVEVSLKFDLCYIDACREALMKSEDFLLRHFNEILSRIKRLFSYKESPMVLHDNSLLANSHKHNLNPIPGLKLQVSFIRNVSPHMKTCRPLVNHLVRDFVLEHKCVILLSQERRCKSAQAESLIHNNSLIRNGAMVLGIGRVELE